MQVIPSLLTCMLLLWGIVTAPLAALVIYRTTLSRREDDSLYLNKAEAALMAGEQDVIGSRMERLRNPIAVLGALSALSLAASAVMWLWAGFRSF